MNETEIQNLVTMISSVVDQKIEALRTDLVNALDAYQQWTVEQVEGIDNSEVTAEFASRIDEFWTGAINAAYKGKRRKSDGEN